MKQPQDRNRRGPRFQYDPVVWFYKARTLSEKAYPMTFSAILKKCLPALMAASLGAWLIGCAETSSTPKPAPSPSSTSTAKSVSPDKASPETPAKEERATGSGSSSEGSESVAGSETAPGAGREVPEAAPPTDDEKPGDEKSDDEKPSEDKPEEN
jgi:hypothetical protein